jgi:hypothetical protein
MTRIRRPLAAALWVAVLAAGAGAAGCGRDPEDPESRVRRVLGELEAAVEAGDAGAFKERISERYTDPYGHDRRALMATVTFHLMRNGRRHAWVRVHSVSLRGPGRAEVTLAAGLAGRPLEGPEDPGRLRADVWKVDLDLEREEDAWRVVWAQWRRTAATDLL